MKDIRRSQIVISISLIIVFAFAFISFFNYASAKNAAINEIKASGLPLTRENIYSRIMKILLPPKSISSLMAHDSFLIEWTKNGEKNVQEITSYLAEIQKEYNFFSTFFVSESSENYYHFSGLLKKIDPGEPQDNWYYNFVNSWSEFDLNVDIDEANNFTLAIFINYRVEDKNGKLIGAAGVGLEVQNFSKILTEIQNKFGRRVYLINKSGLIQAHSDTSKIEREMIFRVPGLNTVADQLLTKSEDPVDLTYSKNGKTTLVTSRFIPEIDWYLIVEQDQNTALITANNNLLRTIIIGILTIFIVIFLVILLQNRYTKNLENLAVTDTLTKLPNRRRFNLRFENAANRFNRYGTEFCMILMDVDQFKKINDTLGHPVGDTVLVKISEIISKNIRSNDMLARWGGDEFIAIYEGEMKQAVATTERIIEAVRKSEFPDLVNANYKPTLSCGIIKYHENGTIESMTQKADQLMYKAKQNGKDQLAFE